MESNSSSNIESDQNLKHCLQWPERGSGKDILCISFPRPALRHGHADVQDESYLLRTFSWIDEDHLFAGSSCPGLNTSMGTDAKFLQTRVRGVISLNDSELDWSPLISVGIRQLSIAVPDYRAPTVEQMHIIVDFVQSLGTNSPVLIHCNAGMGRTGTVLASLLVWKRGLSAAEAIRQVRFLRKGSVQTYKQEEGVVAWAAALVHGS
jgi:atypical dual specificity phosphatase